MGFDQIKVELTSSWGGDRDAANAAWASSVASEKLSLRNEEDVRRIVTGLVTNGHDTPKERIWMEFFITCPIYTERQMDKYRLTLQYQQFTIECEVGAFGRWGITQNELSGRYRTIPDRPYTLPMDVANICERASVTEDQTGKSWNPAQDVADAFNEMLEEQHREYQGALRLLKEGETKGQITNAEYKRAREVLRGLLGTSFLTDMRMVMNMNAFEHIINQRLDPAAQLESRIVAARMLDQAIQAGVAPIMVNEMIHSNGWAAWLEDLDV
jgi:thymidylate synthase ThyX